MFTGLVEEKGKLSKIEKNGLGLRLTFNSSIVISDIKNGSSIAVNGVCLTVIDYTGNHFSVDVIEETLKKSNLGRLQLGDFVNLERPIKADARLGGHFVLGHVDSTGIVVKIEELSNSHFMTISFHESFRKYLIYVGSISIDGVSMTVANIEHNTFSVGIIPHTWNETIFSEKKINSEVNLEFDVLGKYVETIMKSNSTIVSE